MLGFNMNVQTLEFDKKQLIKALVKYTPNELKDIIDELLNQKAFTSSTLDEITNEASTIVKDRSLSPDIVKDAIEWARSKK